MHRMLSFSKLAKKVRSEGNWKSMSLTVSFLQVISASGGCVQLFENIKVDMGLRGVVQESKHLST